jgi:hypothetical protein
MRKKPKPRPLPKKPVTLSDIKAELKTINKKLDYCVMRLGPGNGEEFEN